MIWYILVASLSCIFLLWSAAACAYTARMYEADDENGRPAIDDGNEAIALATALNRAEMTDEERTAIREWLAYETPQWAHRVSPEQAIAEMLRTVEAVALATALNRAEMTDEERTAIREWLAYETPQWARRVSPEQAIAEMLRIVRVTIKENAECQYPNCKR